jgi:hypothetical protein
VGILRFYYTTTFICGQFVVNSDDVALKPGKYDIYVTCPGYVSKRMWVEIKEADLSIEIILDKK